MRASEPEPEHPANSPGLTLSLTVLGGAIAALLAISTLPFDPPLQWFLALCVAAISWSFVIVGDPVSRKSLKDGLRQRDYALVYHAITGRVLRWVWSLLQPGLDLRGWPTPDRPEPFRRIWGFVRTYRLFDGALVLAFLYPIVLPAMQWIVTGQDTGIVLPDGTHLFPEILRFFPERALVLGSFVLFAGGLWITYLPQTIPNDFVRRNSEWFGLLAGAFAVAGAFAFAFAV
ncbi:MAG: hypothetical protein AAFR45_04575, partial [Pseudomonadota bacterium]